MNALYYPFHLCHETTLHRLLTDYWEIHFRDYMALQLTPMVGTTAFPDRMGDYYPGFWEGGRIVQGHNVSGPMNPEVIAAVNRDCADLRWRFLFHEALQSNYQFQRGLIDVSQLELGRSPESEASTPLLGVASSDWADQPFQVAMVQGLGGRRLSEEEQSRFEYGLALIKTAVKNRKFKPYFGAVGKVSKRPWEVNSASRRSPNEGAKL